MHMDTGQPNTGVQEEGTVQPTQLECPQENVDLFIRLAQIASENPARGAVVQNGSVVTYGEIVRQSGRFCRRLAAAGVRPHERVAVILGNTVDFIVAAFGIWKRGSVLVPLNPQLYEDEVLKYLAGTSARAIVTSLRNRAMAEVVQARGERIGHLWLCPPNEGEWIYKGSKGSSYGMTPSESCEVQIAPDWPAVAQYSTGSSGYPKRVTRTHAQLLGEFRSVSRVLSATRSDRILGAAPFFHSHGLMNSAVLALLSGGTLYPIESFFPREVARLIDDERITVFPGVPFMFQLLADLRERHHFFHLRCAISAGAPLSEGTEHAFKRVYSIAIRQLYGSTETGVICIEAADGRASDPHSVGPPIPGVAVRVLDDSAQHVAVGCEGRIHVVSPFAASTYENAIGSSESGFESSGFFPGDLGCMTSAGELVLRGRYRGFINVGGNKVDPSEVEAILLELPKVTEAVVFGIPDVAAGEKVKAVLVTETGVTQADIRIHCMHRMAEFKHPRVIEFRRELPKSPLGKVLRKYLMDEMLSTDRKVTLDREVAAQLIDQDDAKGAPSLRFSELPPFLRVLLMTDGTVTRSLEAYFGEPIDVDVLSHSELRSDRSYPEVNVALGDPILRRCVTLRGRITRSIYAFAESVVVLASISNEMKRKLIEERKGIGELLSASKLETFRELLRIRRACAKEWAVHLSVAEDARVVIRNYKIFRDGRAAMEIEEVFPELRFFSDHSAVHTQALTNQCE